jgi:hypothetical protein
LGTFIYLSFYQFNIHFAWKHSICVSLELVFGPCLQGTDNSCAQVKQKSNLLKDYFWIMQRIDRNTVIQKSSLQSWVLVAHACNPTYLGGRVDHSS